MLVTQCEKIYLEMTASLHSEKGELVSDLKRLSSSLSIVESSISQARLLLQKLGFANDNEEVQFFKSIKPKFFSWKIFLIEQYNIIANIPVDTIDRVRKYYIKELDFLQRYFDQNQFLYQYYLTHQSALDDLYFLRRNRDRPEASILSPNFETQADYVFAKFRAHQLLKDFLLTRIRLMYAETDSSLYQILSQKTGLKWTDDKVKLVELAYGIYFMGSLNDGKADISQVVQVLERALNVDLGVVYRKFIDITRRKSKGYTIYLDSMREAINTHIAEKYRN